MKAIDIAQGCYSPVSWVTTSFRCGLIMCAESVSGARRGCEAAAEFQKIVDYRHLVQNDVIGALARLGLARAYALQGNTAKARTQYQDFLTLWKDADPDVPVLKQAKAEYAKLSE